MHVVLCRLHQWMLSSGWLTCVLSLLVLAAPCPADMSGVIPLGCPVELTQHQEALIFQFQYYLLEECTWSVNNQSVGSTSYLLNPQRTLTSGQTAVVSNYVSGQSDLTLTTQGEPSSLEGMEVKCSCQPRGGEEGPTREAKTVIGETGVTVPLHCTTPVCLVHENIYYEPMLLPSTCS